MEIIPLLALIHLLGALFGTFYTTFAELFYLKAVKDGVVDKHERHYLRRLFRGLQVGMLLVLFSGTALIVTEYLVPGMSGAAATSAFWAVQSLTAIILVFGYLLSRRQSPWKIASAAILTGWWMLLVADFGVFNSMNYLAIMSIYVVAAAVIAGLYILIPNPQAD